MSFFQDELCWDTEDISYLKSNSRSKTDSISNWLGEEYVEKLLQWNKADWMLYQHFNATFAHKVDYLYIINHFRVEETKCWE